MEEMRQRFDEIIKYRKGKNWGVCPKCPCFKECKNLLKVEYSCEDMFFAYITLGKNFDLQREKILKTLDKPNEM